MPELCKIHNLALGPNGKCVVCRRPKPSVFAVREEHEALVSKIFTWLLLVGLLGALSALLYVSRLDAAHASARYTDAPGLGRADGSAPSLRPNEQRSVAEEADGDDRGAKPQPKTGPNAPAARAAGAVAGLQSVASGSPRTSTKTVATLPTAGPIYEVAVTMYAAPWCYICDRSRDFLLARNVVLTERDIERDASSARRLRRLNPALSVPTFEIEGRAYVGFNAWDLEDALHASVQQHYSASVP